MLNENEMKTVSKVYDGEEEKRKAEVEEERKEKRFITLFSL